MALLLWAAACGDAGFRATLQFAHPPAHRCSLKAALPFSFSWLLMSRSMYAACAASLTAFSVSCSRFRVSAFLQVGGGGNSAAETGWDVGEQGVQSRL